ncbi:MAG TPA: AAA family ATPase [Kofleriaceae bacterium]|jgi:exonuclease SbcC|nr:AAA family ATPase [Kofleriaceae bacterium]
MKILAIRGCNLASLAGEFEIDLARGPLGDAGVFAIVGPTGAGKSTLLDAMCAALFDRTPRLANHSPFKVGRSDDDPATLGAQDVRTLLRRGASNGYAEVDFESGDRRRYRARWQVRRARNASDGTLQDVQVSLAALDDEARIAERLGGTKTETLKAIVDRLGLTFDQFRRSALLAQGDFAAFLRADGKDRSELLERMTGTEIYSRLSIAAHQRAALADQQLRDQHGAALAIGVLADDARTQAVAELELAHHARDSARDRLARAETFARWRIEAERRARELAQARAAARVAELDAQAAEPLQAELELRRRAEALRGVWHHAQAIDAQLAVTRGKLAQAREATARARARHGELAEHRERLAQLHAPIRDARQAAGLVEQPPREPSGEATAFAVRAIATRDAGQWLRERAVLAAEIAVWPELDARFAQHAQLVDAIAVADRTLGDQAARSSALDRKRAAVVADHRAAAAAHAKAVAAANTFNARGVPFDAARRAEDEARRHHAELERLVATAHNARDAARARTELDDQLAELENRAAGDGERRVVLATELEGARVLVAERERALAELRRAAGYAHARTELALGEPCPLCGATEHPWRERGALDTLVADAEAKRDEAIAFGDSHRAELAQLDARAGMRSADMARLANLRRTADANVELAAKAWREQLAALGELVLVGDAASTEADVLANERAEAARIKLEAARAARSQAEAAAKAVADAQARVQMCAAEVEHHGGALREVDAELAVVAKAVERTRGERDGRVERMTELAAQLAAAVARWNVVAGDPERMRSAIAELVATWRRHASDVVRADAELAGALEAAERERLVAEREVAEAAAREAGLADDARDRAAELAVAADALDVARTEASFDADTLRRLLADGPARAEALAEQLARIARSLDRAHALVREHARLVAEHDVARPADYDAGESDLAELAANVARAVDAAARAAAALAADDDARARRTAALGALAEAERAAELDRVLGHVIGSHDGKLFRSFAQSLTLDGLLAVANSHLEELAPRYQLERVPKHDLELQVIDRDFGGEVRSVQSLSGGESFLVSLALALGLSSMSAHDVRVRTLLIDEGFGTLDPATLDTALAVLDDLQATGRQVGVISHVPALLDRVKAHVRVAPRGGGRSEVLVPSRRAQPSS